MRRGTEWKLQGVDVSYSETPCYVAKIDRKLGISIHKYEDDELMYCLAKDPFIICKKVWLYDKAFDRVCKMIKKGELETIVVSFDKGTISEGRQNCKYTFHCAF